MKEEKIKSDTVSRRQRQKKPYRRPEIVYREPLEAMAALCTPAPPAKINLGACPTAQRS